VRDLVSEVPLWGMLLVWELESGAPRAFRMHAMGVVVSRDTFVGTLHVRSLKVDTVQYCGNTSTWVPHFEEKATLQDPTVGLMPRVLRGWAFSYERGTPVMTKPEHEALRRL